MSDDSDSRSISRRNVLQTVGVAGAVGLAGCSGGSNGGNGDGGGGQSTQTETETSDGGMTDSGGSGSEDALRIGVTVPRSGPYASVGENNLAAFRATVAMWEEKTGQTVELFVRDTETSPDTGSRVARELIEQEDVHMLHGSYSSAVALAIGSVAQNQEVPYLTTAGSTAFTGSECKEYAFGVNPTVRATAVGIINYMLDNFGSTVYNLTHNYTAGTSGLNAARELVPQLGGEIVGNSFVELGQTDMSTQITQAASSGADILLTHVYAADLATFLQQANDFGLLDDMNVGCSSIDLESTFPVGPEIVQKVYGTPQGWWTFENSGVQEMNSRVRDSIGRPAGMGAPSILGGMDTGLTVLNEVDDPSDGAAIVSELEGREWSIKTFGENRDGQYLRACDHRAPLPIPVAEGKSPSEASSQYDLFNILSFVSAEEATRACEDTGCSL